MRENPKKRLHFQKECAILSAYVKETAAKSSRRKEDGMIKIGEYSGGALAYLGDAVFELLVRETVLRAGPATPGELNRRAQSYVRAGAQSNGARRLEGVLTEEEQAVYRRGRNTHPSTIPQSATMAEYRRATGLEALFAYLYLEGQNDRMRELFALAFPDESRAETSAKPADVK